MAPRGWPVRPAAPSSWPRPPTLAAAGIAPGADATLETERGTITLPAAIADLPDSVAWVPECSTGSVIHENLGGAGTVATLRATQEVAR